MITPKRPGKDQIENEFEGITAKVKSKPTISTKEADAEVRRREEVKQAVSSLSVDKALQSVSGSSLQVSKAFAQLSEELIQQTQQLDTLREAIKIDKEELERLHGVDVVASNIDRLVAEYEEKKAVFQKTTEEEKVVWDRTRRDRDENEARMQAEKILTIQREEDAYRYRMEQIKRSDDDQWQEVKRQRARAEQERQEATAKNWKEREEVLAKSEQEIVVMRQQIADFPTKIDAEVKKAESIVGRSMKKDYEAEAALKTSQWEGQLNLFKQQIGTYEMQIKAKESEITELRAQRTASEANVKEIATKAVEAASSKMSFAELANLRGNDNSTARKPS